jgi:hypothetical protein
MGWGSFPALFYIELIGGGKFLNLCFEIRVKQLGFG